MPLEQSGRVKEERHDQTLGLGEVERALQCTLGPTRIAERVARDRFDEESLNRPDPGTHRQGRLVEQGRERDRGSLRVVVCESQRRACDAHLREHALCVVGLGEDLFAALDLAKSHQRSNQMSPAHEASGARPARLLSRSGGPSGRQECRLCGRRSVGSAGHRADRLLRFD
jgi:hypothetical protein